MPCRFCDAGKIVNAGYAGRMYGEQVEDLIQHLLRKITGKAFGYPRDALGRGVSDDRVLVSQCLEEVFEHGLDLFRYVDIVIIIGNSFCSEPVFLRQRPP